MLKTTFGPNLTNLPRLKTRRTEQMAARFDPHVLVVLGAYLAQLESGAHFAVELVLLLSDLDVLLTRVLNRRRQIRVDVPTVGVQVET